jgi:nucleoside-diphosphate-sugar epimerase
MKNNKVEILITGATGYIGYNFVLFLEKKGFKTHILVRKSSKTRDLEKKHNVLIHYYNGSYEAIDKIFSENKIQIIFHLATHYDKSDDLITLDRLKSVSIDLTNQLFAVIKKQTDFIGFVNIGTIWQLNYILDNPYSLYKVFQDELSKYYSIKYNIKVISLLLRDSYGPDDWRPKFLNKLKLAINDEVNFHITNPNTKIEMLFIDDICEALFHTLELLIVESTPYNQYKLVSLDKISLRDLVKYVETIIGSSIKISFGDSDSHIDVEEKPELEINELPGFSPKVKLAQGLRMVFSKQERNV